MSGTATITERQLVGYYRLLKAVFPDRFPKRASVASDNPNPQLKAQCLKEQKCQYDTTVTVTKQPKKSTQAKAEQ